MRLSVALAVHDEAANIADCLETVRNWCDEIIVVDGDSRDGTAAVARKMGARVISTRNRENFHINKQMAIDACGGDWILQLDADERVTDKLRSEIDTVIRAGNYDGYWIPRQNFFFGQIPDERRSLSGLYTASVPARTGQTAANGRA